MTQLQQRGQAEPVLLELGEIARSIGSSFHLNGSMSRRSSSVAPISDNDDNNDQLWTAVERLATSDKDTQYVFDDCSSAEKKLEGNRDVDVRKLGALEMQLLIDKLIKHVENDNLRLRQLLMRLGLALQRLNHYLWAQTRL